MTDVTAGEDATIGELVGEDLGKFKIVECTEAYACDDEGFRPESLGCFSSRAIALAFIEPRTTDTHLRLQDVLILTDGTVSFDISECRPINLFSDEEAVNTIKQNALEKLTEHERQVLGL